MILVQLCVLLDAARVLGVVRSAMEADLGATLRIDAAREVARVEQSADPADVRLKREREQVELQLDVCSSNDSGVTPLGATKSRFHKGIGPVRSSFAVGPRA